MLIAHLSDPHLAAEGQLYKGLVNSNAMFQEAVDTVLALKPQPDIVIIGGDLVDDGTAAEYQTVRRALEKFKQPVFVIPGNHDDPQGIRRCLAGAEYLTASGPLHFDTEADWPIRIIGLDVTVPGRHHGDFDDAAARWLSHRLELFTDHPTIILMHQPPIESGIAYIDAYKCHNGARLAEIISQRPNVERVLCGHIHRFMQMRFGGSLLTTCPSTTTAIALGLTPDAPPASFVEPPAFLLHQYRPTSGLLTHWVPVGEFPGPYDFI